MGRRAGDFFDGTEFYYQDLFKLRQSLIWLLKRDGDVFKLPPETFVFASINNRSYHFFDTSEFLEDPPIYGYTAGEKQIRLIRDSFSDYLVDALAEQKDELSKRRRVTSDVLADL